MLEKKDEKESEPRSELYSEACGESRCDVTAGVSAILVVVKEVATSKGAACVLLGRCSGYVGLAWC